tara:strand:+ start:109 stop:639 length:531 start_codon:yes stop_codon:yes gene_type:complete
VISIKYAVETIQTYCEYFTARVPNTAKDQWVRRLRELNPSRPVLDAAVRRCADNDLGPSWSRLRAAIATERSIERSRRFDASTGDSRAYEDFKRQYEKDGFAAKPVRIRDNTNDRTTEPQMAAICYRVIGKILRRSIKCPKEFAFHDVGAIGDREEEWFWGEVAKEAEKRKNYGNY